MAECDVQCAQYFTINDCYLKKIKNKKHILSIDSRMSWHLVKICMCEFACAWIWTLTSEAARIKLFFFTVQWEKKSLKSTFRFRINDVICTCWPQWVIRSNNSYLCSAPTPSSSRKQRARGRTPDADPKDRLDRPEGFQLSRVAARNFQSYLFPTGCMTQHNKLKPFHCYLHKMEPSESIRRGSRTANWPLHRKKGPGISNFIGSIYAED